MAPASNTALFPNCLILAMISEVRSNVEKIRPQFSPLGFAQLDGFTCRARSLGEGGSRRILKLITQFLSYT
jgi:hypothetical protein